MADLAHFHNASMNEKYNIRLTPALLCFNVKYIRMPYSTNHKVFEYKICYHEALRANTIFYEIQDFTLIDLLQKLASPASIFSNIQIETLFIIALLWYSMLIISILSQACHMQNTNILTFFLVTKIYSLI